MRRRQMYRLNQMMKPAQSGVIIRMDEPHDEEMSEAKEKKLTSKKRGRPKKQEV